MYYVKGTYREDECDDNSPIIGLVLDEKYKNFTVHSIVDLKPLADSRQLKVYSDHCGFHVQVIIYFNKTYNRYIATTAADGRECNNLLSLPIFYPTSTDGSKTTYSQCSL